MVRKAIDGKSNAISKFISVYKKAFSIMFSPSKVKSTKSINETLKFYYVIALIPALLTILISAVIIPPTLAFISYAVFVMLFFLFLPVGILVSSILYYVLINKLIKMYKNDLKDTFTAFTYAYLPYIMLFWLLVTPPLGYLVEGIIGIWVFVLSLFIFAKMFNMSKSQAFVTIIINGVVWGIVAFIIMILLA